MTTTEPRCNICKRPLNQTNEDCGGDCLRCMAEAGDPECIERVLFKYSICAEYKKLAALYASLPPHEPRREQLRKMLVLFLNVALAYDMPITVAVSS